MHIEYSTYQFSERSVVLRGLIGSLWTLTTTSGRQIVGLIFNFWTLSVNRVQNLYKYQQFCLFIKIFNKNHNKNIIFFTIIIQPYRVAGCRPTWNHGFLYPKYNIDILCFWCRFFYSSRNISSRHFPENDVWWFIDSYTQTSFSG